MKEIVPVRSNQTHVVVIKSSIGQLLLHTIRSENSLLNVIGYQKERV